MKYNTLLLIFSALLFCGCDDYEGCKWSLSSNTKALEVNDTFELTFGIENISTRERIIKVDEHFGNLQLTMRSDQSCGFENSEESRKHMTYLQEKYLEKEFTDVIGYKLAPNDKKEWKIKGVLTNADKENYALDFVGCDKHFTIDKENLRKCNKISMWGIWHPVNPVMGTTGEEFTNHIELTVGK